MKIFLSTHTSSSLRSLPWIDEITASSNCFLISVSDGCCLRNANLIISDLLIGCFSYHLLCCRYCYSKIQERCCLDGIPVGSELARCVRVFAEYRVHFDKI